jgi:hypothetical protein
VFGYNVLPSFFCQFDGLREDIEPLHHALLFWGVFTSASRLIVPDGSRDVKMCCLSESSHEGEGKGDAEPRAHFSMSMVLINA